MFEVLLDACVGSFGHKGRLSHWCRCAWHGSVLRVV